MYLGIDLGTSAVKIVLINEQFQILGQASYSLQVSNPQPLWSEQMPEDWWLGTCAAMAELQHQHAPLLSQVRAIGLSGQMHGATLLDKQDRILRPAILWNDGRSFAQCQQLEAAVPGYATIVGSRIMPGFTAPKLKWLAQWEPEVFSQIAKVLLPKDYLRLRMTHTYGTDCSDAAGTGWLDVGKRQWSEPMLTATGLGEQHMPHVFEGSAITATVTSELAKQWGIPKTTVVVGGGGDNAASAISMDVIEPGSAFISLGSSGVYFVANDVYLPNAAEGIHTFCHCLPQRWHQMSVSLSAASCLDWWARTVGSTAQQLLQEAEQSPDHKDNTLFLPYLSGERTPHNDPYARGVFFGLSHTTERVDMTRAVLQGVAFAFADGQQAMLKTQLPITEVSVVGGGARSLYWGKLLAAALNRPLTYRQDRETGAALGAARLAWLGVHDVDPQSAFTPPAIEQVVEPEPALVEKLQRKREIYRQLYPALKGFFPAISGV